VVGDAALVIDALIAELRRKKPGGGGNALTALKEDIAAVKPDLKGRVEQMGQLLREAVAQTRILARGLVPVRDDPDALRIALAELAERINSTGQIQCRLECPAPVPIHEPTVAGHLYRIAQEALTNVLKHAAAKAVSLVVRRELGGSSGVHLTVEDDGRGFDSDALLQAPGTGKGLGLLDIRERAALLNGAVTLESRPGSGTTVHVYIPLKEENHGEDSRPDR